MCILASHQFLFFPPPPLHLSPPPLFLLSFSLSLSHVLTDLEYGLPVQVRDQALAIKDTVPKSDVGREYFLQNLENQVSSTFNAKKCVVVQ